MLILSMILSLYFACFHAAAFADGCALQKAAERDLILVDTKFEFGKDESGAIVLADEILTPDSSRLRPLTEPLTAAGPLTEPLTAAGSFYSRTTEPISSFCWTVLNVHALSPSEWRHFEG